MELDFGTWNQLYKSFSYDFHDSGIFFPVVRRKSAKEAKNDIITEEFKIILFINGILIVDPLCLCMYNVYVMPICLHLLIFLKAYEKKEKMTKYYNNKIYKCMHNLTAKKGENCRCLRIANFLTFRHSQLIDTFWLYENNVFFVNRKSNKLMFVQYFV